MKRAFVTLFLLLFAASALGVIDHGSRSFGAGGVFSGGLTPLALDHEVTTLTGNQCTIFTGSTLSGGCAGTTRTVRWGFGGAVTIRALEVQYKQGAPSATLGCEFEILTGVNDADPGTLATLSTRPVVGDQDPGAGFTLVNNLTTTRTARATLNVSVPAGGWVSIRAQDVPTASVGNDGVCGAVVLMFVVLGQM